MATSSDGDNQGKCNSGAPSDVIENPHNNVLVYPVKHKIIDSSALARTSPVMPEVEGGWTAPSTPIRCNTPTLLNAVNDVGAANALQRDNFTPETYIRGMKRDTSSISMLQPLTNLIESDLIGPLNAVNDVDATNVLQNDNFAPETYIRGMKRDTSSISMLQPLTNLIESDLMGPMTELMKSIDAANASTANSSRWTPPLRESPDKSNETCLEVEADTVVSTHIASRNINIDLKNEAQPVQTNGSQDLGQMLSALDDAADEDCSSSSSSSSLSSSSSSSFTSNSSSSYGLSSSSSESSEENSLFLPQTHTLNNSNDFQRLIEKTHRHFASRLKYVRSIADGDARYESCLLRNELKVQQGIIDEIRSKIDELDTPIASSPDSKVLDDLIVRYENNKESDHSNSIFQQKQVFFPESIKSNNSIFMRIMPSHDWYHSFPAYGNILAYCVSHICIYNLIQCAYGQIYRKVTSPNVEYTLCVLMMTLMLGVMRICGSFLNYLSREKSAGYKFNYLNRLKLGIVNGELRRWFKEHPKTQMSVDVVSNYIVWICVNDILTGLREIFIRDAQPVTTVDESYFGLDELAEDGLYPFLGNFLCDYEIMCCNSGIFYDLRTNIESEVLESYQDINANYDFSMKTLFYTILFNLFFGLPSLFLLKYNRVEFW